MVIAEKSLIKQRFSRALASYDQHAVVQQQIARRLVALLPERQFQSVLEIGCGTGDLSQHLQQHCVAKRWIFNDLCDVRQQLAHRHLPQPFEFLQGDAEQLDFAPQFDLIASASTLQWFSEPEKFVQRCKNWLLPNGLLFIATFAPENLTEIRQLTNIGLNYPSSANWQNWLKDFDVKVLQSETITLQFDSPLAVLQHLKQSGVTATAKTAWTKGQLAEFCQQYQQHFGEDSGKVRLSYQPLFILAKKRDDD